MKLPKINHKHLTEEVYESLKKAIYTHELEPGEKLDIYKIAELYGVSRSPVKEAFNRLHLEGLIKIVPRRGTFIAKFNSEEIAELLDARYMIEAWAAKKMIPKIVSKQVEKMELIFDNMSQILEAEPFNYFEYNKNDIEFHRILIEELENKSILKMYDLLNAQWFAGRGKFSFAKEKTKQFHFEHLEMIEAIKNRDLQQFEKILEKHISNIKKDLTNVLRDE